MQVTAKDPDKGSASMTYDNNDQLLTTTDNRGISTRVEYDELGRKVGLYDGLSIDPAKLRASWVYDTLAAGQLIGWTAGKIDDGIDFAQDVDYTFWN